MSRAYEQGTKVRDNVGLAIMLLLILVALGINIYHSARAADTMRSIEIANELVLNSIDRRLEPKSQRIIKRNIPNSVFGKPPTQSDIDSATSLFNSLIHLAVLSGERVVALTDDIAILEK